MQVKIKKLSTNAVMPTKAHPTDAGYDLTAIGRSFDEHGNVVYHFGLALEIPEGYAGFIFPRSSISKKTLSLTNCVGVIDAGYRGEVTAKFKSAIEITRLNKRCFPRITYPRCRVYETGERVAQLIILPIPKIEFTEVDELTESERGTGGYGSSGK